MSRWLVDTQVAVSKWGGTLAGLRERLSRIVERDVPMANARESAALIKCGMDAARRARLAGKREPEEIASFLTSPRSAPIMEKVANAMDRKIQLKAKAAMASAVLGSPAVFYAVSTHQKPRDSHEPLQGTVCYDRNWRRKLQDAGMWDLAKRVGRHIRAEGMRSAQDLMGPPCYLMTAPYCRHRLFPLDTEEVLDGTANTRILDGAHRSLTPEKRYAAYKKRRALVRSRATPREKIRTR